MAAAATAAPPLHTAVVRHASALTPGAALARAAASGTRLHAARDIPNLDAIVTPEDAYRVQRDAAGYAARHFGVAQVGWKIGATNAAAQARMGLVEPFYGPVLQANLALSPATISLGKAPYRVRGVEAEYAFLVAADLPAPAAGGAPLTREEVAAAVGAVYPVIEVCGSRLADNPPPTPAAPGGVPLATLLSIADQASHGSLVRAVRLAKPRPAWDALVGAAAGGFAGLPVTLSINGAQVAAGSGADVLGDPLTALTWLANALHRAGAHLRAGDIVTSGTMTGLTPVRAGDAVRAEFAGFGAVEVKFTE